MKSYWVEHKGKRVFIAEYSNFGTNSIALRHEADEIIATFAKEPDQSVRAISNVEGTKATQLNVKILMEILSNSKRPVFKRCVVGVSGARWTFLDAFNQLISGAKFNSFDTLDKALDWIVQD